MKRQRRVDHVTLEAPKLEGATILSMPRKKSKTKGAAKVKEEASIISDNVSVNDQTVAAHVAVAVEEEEEEYSCTNGSFWLDEEVSWGPIWSPLRDVEFMSSSEAHYGVFSDHVEVWDDDIWGLRTTNKEMGSRFK